MRFRRAPFGWPPAQPSGSEVVGLLGEEVNVAAPGWYPNPDRTQTLRYWDGERWTEHSTLPAVGTPPGAGQLAYGPAIQSPETNGMATAGLVLGILGAVIEWGGILTLTAGILAIVFGSIGIGRAGRLGGTGRGRAITGLILGCFSLVAYLFWGLVTFGFLWII